MRDTKLILIDGLLGSGKSTLAGFLARQLGRGGIAHRWWYEEDKWHPLYLFHDQASLQRVLDLLQAGEYRRVVEDALEKWQQLSDALRRSPSVVLLDGCLFGYLTWTLFTFDVPEAEILAYVARVVEIIGPNKPCLIYLYQDDVVAALKRYCARGGQEAEQRLAHNVEQSLYGKRRGLQGFAGAATFWSEYRQITDEAFSRIDFSKLAIENSAEDWEDYQQRALDFLELAATEEVAVTHEELERYSGTYEFLDGDARRTCRVGRDDGGLVVEDVPQLWRKNRLVPVAPNVFAVESFPFEIRFEADESGIIRTMVLAGPEQLFGTINTTFSRKEG